MSCVNSDNFLAVALVINRSRDGPAFVFHYPPNVQPVSGNAIEASPYSNGETSNPTDLEDILLERLSHSGNRDISGFELPVKHYQNQHNHSNFRHHDDHTLDESGYQNVPWDHVAGFPTRDLAGILTPARAFHKKLFQLSLDPLYCVSYPIHVPENGKWKKCKKSNKPSDNKSAPQPEEQDDEHESDFVREAQGSSSQQEEVVVKREEKDNEREREKGKDQDKEREKEGDADEEKRSSMTMFNLVFILNPKKNEARALVESLYSNIVKKINKAYNYSQQHSDFVWKESKRILATKDRAREERKNMSELWRELLQTSSLAASVHDIYEAVSHNKVATLHLDTAAGVLNPSVQIPAPFYVADIPPENDNRERGLWLTTANAFLSQDAIEEPGFLDRNFALLLIDDEKKIIAELQADRDPANFPMVEFVRLSKPTMSFFQVAQSNVLTLSQVRKYAQHFIFWRRAIAIPPLHARDTYFVSPNCDLSRLPEASLDWQREFPVAPALPNFLTELSVCPRPYKTFCPNKVHRPLYLRMLAWLVRGGWVTQLCTFAYVVVWPEIIYEVEYEMEAEELDGVGGSSAPQSSSPVQKSPPTSEEIIPTTTEAARSLVVTSPAFRKGQTSPFRIDDDPENSPFLSPASNHLRSKTGSASPSTEPVAGSATNFITTSDSGPSTVQQAAEQARLDRIAAKASRDAADKVTAHARKILPIATPHPSTNDAPHLAGLIPHIILDAKKATGQESRYLSAIAARLARDDGGKLRQAWQTMCSRYFDGHTPLERVALQEDMKRKEAWMLLSAMSEYLLCTRHW